MHPETIVFYKSYYDAVSDLPEKMQISVYKSIFSFAFDGKEPELLGMANTVWKLIRPTIEASILNYKNGKKGGRPKIGVTEIKKGGFPEKDNPPSEKAETNKDKDLNKDKDKELKEPRADKSANYSPDFEIFWTAYPKKEGKRGAEKAFLKAIKKTDLQNLVQAIEVYKKSETVRNGFVCQPATWLNNERWLDEKSEVKTITDPKMPPGAVRRTASGWWVDKNGNPVIGTEY